jgi:hypothetical protein
MALPFLCFIDYGPKAWALRKYNSRLFQKVVEYRERKTYQELRSRIESEAAARWVTPPVLHLLKLDSVPTITGITTGSALAHSGRFPLIGGLPVRKPFLHHPDRRPILLPGCQSSVGCPQQSLVVAIYSPCEILVVRG